MKTNLISYVLIVLVVVGMADTRVLSKKHRKPKALKRKLSKLQRNLFGAQPPQVTSDGLFMAENLPQISAPRMNIRNFPKPPEDLYQYPQRNLANNPLPPNMTILPTRTVSTEGNDNYVQNRYLKDGGQAQQQYMPANGGAPPRKLSGQLPPNLTVLPARVVDSKQDADYLRNNSQLLLNNAPGSGIDMRSLTQGLVGGQKKRKHKRHLSVTPYMHMGPGYMDVAQSGYSPMGLAMANPDLHSMSPFLPRPNPPPPLRIQLRDPVEEKYRRNILTQSEYQVEDMKTKKLQNKLVNELKGLQTDMENKRKELTEQFKEISNTAELIGQHKEEVATQTNVLKQEIDQQLEDHNEVH